MYISKLEANKLVKKKLFKKYKLRQIEKNNQRYINKVLEENKEFLGNINGHSLDNVQREIVVSEEDSTLVVAGAGSGKSLTIIGKILYLIKQGISPSDILVVSFTNEASNSLYNTLLKNGVDVEIMTFHKLGRQILKENGYSVDLVANDILENVISNNIASYNNLKIMLPDMDFITIGDDMEDLQKIILLNSDEVKNLKKLFLTFINLFKSGNYKKEDFDRFIKENEKEEGYIRDKHNAFLILAKKMYLDYNYYLFKNRKIDFHDMINKSIDAIKNKGIHKYKYIIIDEYQDTSLVKCELIKTIKDYTNSKLLVVGDDFQSIYRFTGTNLKVFTNFEKYFPYAKIFKLEKTYRNSKELLKITNKFILKNKNQIYKNLYSDKNNKNPILVYYYDKNVFEVLDKVISSIKSDDILIIGRNNKDLSGIKGRTMTVHRSKGLEADNVIIVSLEDALTGFPNKIVNDKVLKYVLDYEDIYPYEEERRLFYVALTRTKNCNYLLVNRNKPSIFALELLKDNFNIKVMNDNEFCPICRKKLIQRESRNGSFYGCTGYPRCRYTKKI